MKYVYYHKQVTECEELCKLLENSEKCEGNDPVLKKIENIRRKVRDLNMDEVN